MLHNAGANALHHRQGLQVIEDHADHAALGHLGMKYGQDCVVPWIFQEFLRKAGAVLLINFLHPAPEYWRQLRHSVHRHIAALRMTADPDHSPMGHHHFQQVFLGKALGWDLLAETHTEILFPSHQCIVCTSERDKKAAIRQ